MSRINSPSRGFNDAIDFGDEALAEGYFTGAAAWYMQAAWHANQAPTLQDYRYYASAAMLRLSHVAGLCLTSALGRTSSRGEDDPWTALGKIAERGFLTQCDGSVIVQLAGLVGPARGGDADPERSQRAWSVLRSCSTLGPWEFGIIDDQLVAEGMHKERAELAMHPSATAAIWLAMLQRCRTPDLVHTLLEMPRAVAEEEVKAALK